MLGKESSPKNQHIFDLWSSFFFSGPYITPVGEEPKTEQPHTKEEEIKENIPANDKTDDYYKNTKQCKILKLIAIYIQKLIILV